MAAALQAEGAPRATTVDTDSATLLRLPDSILNSIIEQVVIDGVGARPASSRRRFFGARQLEPNIAFKDAYQRLSPLIGASRILRATAYSYLGKEVTLHEEDSNRLLFQHKKYYWIKDLLGKIEKMKIGMSFGMKLKPNHMWPSYINFFQKLTPNIIHLELYSTFGINDYNYPRRLSGEARGDVGLLDQERRFKLLFLAYLTSRHRHLNRMILPADSVQVVDRTVYHYLVAEKAFIDTHFDCSFIWSNSDRPLQEDEILNATLIRRQKWTPLCTIPDSQFIVFPSEGDSKDNILTSEVIYDDQRHWAMLDARAYQPGWMAKANKWKSHSVDDLIDSCATFEWRENWAAAALAAAHKAGSQRLRRRLGRASPQEPAVKAYRQRVIGYSTSDYKEQYSDLYHDVTSWTEHRIAEVQSELAQEAAK